jgi:hypothetical protein
MKAISTILIAIMAIASQISSTFAQAPAANPEFVTTPDGRSITINVIANDFTATGVRATTATVVTVSSQPSITSGNGVGGAGSATTVGVVGGSIRYTPVAGFTGRVTFTYTIPITPCVPANGPCPTSPIPHRRNTRDRRTNRRLDVPTLTGIVTVTVVARQIRPDFKAQNQFSTESALATVNLSNLAPSFNISEAIRLAASGGV